ncbi:hypothetical protein [Streptomyces sp. NBC_00893]|uniref:hypothetical protein n=1 Tax=Streptomyces sp. NBC_00893 TaxID=2975862 RepID=UPI00225A4E5A|nr:hypothetical protein [Streptomyces sp. NBC_00893]MCX4847049.1 hypothetical protein [Streptomyces sp. NBC_00893]
MRKPLRALTLLLPLAALPLTASPAHAGSTCFATHADAPVYAGANPWTDIVGYLDPGIPVNATRQGADQLWRVSRTDNGAPLGFMRDGDLRCDGG